MEDKKNAFSNTKIQGKDKYMERHLDAIKIERAKEIDERIYAFDSKEHDIIWAKEAILFCDREEENGKELLEYSKGMQELKRIKREAEDIIKAEEDRIQQLKDKEQEEYLKEQERLKLLAQEEQIKIDAEKEKQNLILEQQKLDFQNAQNQIYLQNAQDRLNLKIEQDKKQFETEQNLLKLKIEQEKNQLEQEQEEQRLNNLKKENEINEKKHNDELIKDLEKFIDSVALMQKDRVYLDSLNLLTLKVKGLGKGLYEKVSNRFVYENLIEEVSDLENALDISDKISELLTQTKNVKWASEVIETSNKLTQKLSKYIKNKDALLSVLGEAKEIFYAKDVQDLKNFIETNENSNKEKLLAAYPYSVRMREVAKTLQDNIDINKYIENFTSRFSQVCEKIDNEKKEFDDKELKKKDKLYKQKLKEKDKLSKKQRKQKEKEKKKKANKKKAQKRNKFLLNAFLVLIQLAITIGFVVYGAVTFNTNLGKVLLLVGACLTVIIPCLHILIGQREDGSGSTFVYTFVPFLINILLLAAAITSIAMPIFNYCAITLSVLSVVLSIFDSAMVFTSNLHVDYQDDFILCGILMIGASIITSIIALLSTLL